MKNARDYMRAVHRAATAGLPGRFDGHYIHPRVMEVGQDLYVAFKDELMTQERFLPVRASADPNAEPELMFRDCVVRPVGTGWHAVVR